MRAELASIPEASQLFSNYSPETPEQALNFSFGSGLIHYFAEQVIAQDFDPDIAQQNLVGAVDTVGQTVIGNVLDLETEIRLDQPLHDYLGELAINATAARDLLPADSYVAGIRSQVEDLPDGYFRGLKPLHEAVAATPYLELVRTVHELAKEGADGWADTAYEAVQTAVLDHFDEYALPDGHEAALYLVCCLPGDARQLTRRLLTNATHFRKIKDLVGNNLSDAEKTTLDAVKRHYQAEVLTGQQWDDLSLSDETVLAAGLRSVDHLDALSLIQNETRNGTIDRIETAWETAAYRLRVSVKQEEQSLGIYKWASIDSGHGFHSFQDSDLDAAFLADTYHNRAHVFEAKKDGTFAIILEDDADQRTTWSNFVDNHLPQTTSEDRTFATPEGIEATVDDPANTLFLLDIQNGKDLTAGVRVAAMILRLRYQQLERAGWDQTQVPRTEIVVWSASQAALAYAMEYLGPITDDMTGISRTLGDRRIGGLGNAKITIEVRPKGFDLYDTAVEEVGNESET